MTENSGWTSRRSYVKGIGAMGATALVSTAGCLGGLGGGSGSMTITPGTAPGFPPFEMRRGGEFVGFDIDLLSAVVENIDYELGDWNAYEFSSLIPALTNENITVIAAAMTITDERDQTIDFTNPYYSADQAILVREGSNFSPSNLVDLSGRPVGVQEGTTGAGVVEEQLLNATRLEQANYNTYGNYVLAVEDLVNRNIDAVVLDTPVARTFVEQRAVTIAAIYETGEQYGFGVRTDANDLTEALNQGLEQVRESGQYEEIRNEWFSGGGGGTGTGTANPTTSE